MISAETAANLHEAHQRLARAKDSSFVEGIEAVTKDGKTPLSLSDDTIESILREHERRCALAVERISGIAATEYANSSRIAV